MGLREPRQQDASGDHVVVNLKECKEATNEGLKNGACARACERGRKISARAHGNGAYSCLFRTCSSTPLPGMAMANRLEDCLLLLTTSTLLKDFSFTRPNIGEMDWWGPAGGNDRDMQAIGKQRRTRKTKQNLILRFLYLLGHTASRC